MKTARPVETREKVLLIGVGLKRTPHLPGAGLGEAERESLVELEELARSSGAEVCGSVLQMREAIDPATVWRTLKKTRSSRG